MGYYPMMDGGHVGGTGAFSEPFVGKHCVTYLLTYTGPKYTMSQNDNSRMVYSSVSDGQTREASPEILANSSPLPPVNAIQMRR